MANLIKFNKEQFDHLSPEEATMVKLLVYRLDFQEGVLNLRKKHSITKFQEIDIKEDISTYMEESNAELDNDIDSLLEKLRYEDEQWFAFTYLFIKYKYISTPHLKDSGFNIDSVIKIEDDYRKADSLFKAGQKEEAIKVLNGADHIIYSSSNVIIETSYRDIQVIFSGVANQYELKKVMKIVKESQKAFGKRGLKPMEQLDMYNYALELHRDPSIDGYANITGNMLNALETKLKNEGQYSDEEIDDIVWESCKIPTIRKWIERGEKLDF